jgi:predicted ATPase
MLGREDQLADLIDLMAQAKRGSGSVAAIVGHPGEGKSRLVHEITQKGHDLGFEVQVFYGRRSAQQTVFSPVLDYMQNSGDFSSKRPTFEEVESWMTQRSADLTIAAPYFDALIKSPGFQQPEQANFSDDERKSALTIFAAGHTEETQSHPTVMVFEDIQWFDPTSGFRHCRMAVYRS